MLGERCRVGTVFGPYWGIKAMLGLLLGPGELGSLGASQFLTAFAVKAICLLKEQCWGKNLFTLQSLFMIKKYESTLVVMPHWTIKGYTGIRPVLCWAYAWTLQECLARISLQECHARVSCKMERHECPCKSVLPGSCTSLT